MAPDRTRFFGVALSAAAAVLLLISGWGSAGIDRLPIAAVVGFALAVVTHRLRLLDARGASGAGVLALSIVWLAGWGWLWPGATFFILSSLLSRVGRQRKDFLPVKAEKSGPRDLAQVVANGGVAWLVLVIAGMVPGVDQALSLAVFGGAFAAAAADTWSTEIGSLSRRVPRLVTSGRRVEAGTSGGVTPLGLAASIAGSASVAASVWLVGGPFMPVLAAGFLGGLADSIAGALFQGRWRVEGIASLVETAQPGRAPERGFAWVTNDVVNLICTAAGAIFAAGLYAVFGA